MLKMKLQYFGHPMQRTDSLEKTLMLERLKAGGEGDDRGWDGWMASSTRWTWVWVSSGSWWWTGKSGVLQSVGSQRVEKDWGTELNWCTYIHVSLVWAFKRSYCVVLLSYLFLKKNSEYLFLWVVYCTLFKRFIYFWLHWVSVAAHGLSLVAASGSCSLVAVLRLLIAVVSFVVHEL